MILGTVEELGNPKTIINLRMGEDKEVFNEVKWLHAPIPNQLDAYHTEHADVR